MAEDERRVRTTVNGPYIVSGDVPMHDETISCDENGDAVEWIRGKDYPRKENYALCRCGGSSNKPYCDGTHMRNGFNGTEVASREPYMERAHRREGPELDLTDARDLCAFARFCHRAGTIWRLIKRSNEPEAREIAIQEGKDCPSGRLVVWTKDGEALEPELEPSIGVVDDPNKESIGPLWVRGGIPVESADGTTHEVRNRVTLCRCGKSGNKPFCDGSHAPEE